MPLITSANPTPSYSVTDDGSINLDDPTSFPSNVADVLDFLNNIEPKSADKDDSCGTEMTLSDQTAEVLIECATGVSQESKTAQQLPAIKREIFCSSSGPEKTFANIERLGLLETEFPGVHEIRALLSEQEWSGVMSITAGRCSSAMSDDTHTKQDAFIKSAAVFAYSLAILDGEKEQDLGGEKEQDHEPNAKAIELLDPFLPKDDTFQAIMVAAISAEIERFRNERREENTNVFVDVIFDPTQCIGGVAKNQVEQFKREFYVVE